MKKLVFLLIFLVNFLYSMNRYSYDMNPTNPLHIAIQRNNYYIINLFLQYPAFHPNEIDPDDNTALHYVVSYLPDGTNNIIESLLEKKANPLLKNRMGETPRMIAMRLEKHTFAGKLYKEELQITNSMDSSNIKEPLDDSEKTLPQTDDCSRFFFQNININLPSVLLRAACITNDCKELKRLLPTVNLFLKDMFDNTPFDYAFCHGNKEATQILIDTMNIPYKAEVINIINNIPLLKEHVDTADNNGNTLLHKSVKANNIYLLQMLMSLGANRSKKNNQGKKPLDLATEDQADIKAYLRKPQFIQKIR